MPVQMVLAHKVFERGRPDCASMMCAQVWLKNDYVPSFASGSSPLMSQFHTCHGMGDYLQRRISYGCLAAHGHPLLPGADLA